MKTDEHCDSTHALKRIWTQTLLLARGTNTHARKQAHRHARTSDTSTVIVFGQFQKLPASPRVLRRKVWWEVSELRHTGVSTAPSTEEHAGKVALNTPVTTRK